MMSQRNSSLCSYVYTLALDKLQTVATSDIQTHKVSDN